MSKANARGIASSTTTFLCAVDLPRSIGRCLTLSVFAPVLDICVDIGSGVDVDGGSAAISGEGAIGRTPCIGSSNRR
jgi:hypothetical protein